MKLTQLINKFKFMGLLVSLGLGIAIGILLMMLTAPGDSDQSMGKQPTTAEKQILYWVAPMDANFRRDSPGKSPMGMALVPVYADDGINPGQAAGQKNSPGVIRISPQVVNNLGVRTVRVERKPLAINIETIGYVQFDESQILRVHPRASGWIDTLYVKAVGEPVSVGQRLYSVYSPELVNAQGDLVLALDRNDKALIKAAEQRLLSLKFSEADIKKLKSSRTILQEVDFLASANGVIQNLNIREGSYVEPSTQLLSIASLDQVWVLAEVFERQVSTITTNDPVSLTFESLPGKQFNGQVDYIYPTLDSQTRTVQIRIKVPNKQHSLKPNMYADVTLLTQLPQASLVVPVDAIILTGKQSRVVAALGEGRFKSIEVKLGRVTGTEAEILNGVEEGELIVSSAQFLLDSESSKTSDFLRIDDKAESVESHQHHSMNVHKDQEKEQSENEAGVGP